MYCYSESSRMQGWLLIQAHLINVVSLGPNWYPVETGRVYGVIHFKSVQTFKCLNSKAFGCCVSGVVFYP